MATPIPITISYSQGGRFRSAAFFLFPFLSGSGFFIFAENLNFCRFRDLPVEENKNLQVFLQKADQTAKKTPTGE